MTMQRPWYLDRQSCFFLFLFRFFYSSLRTGLATTVQAGLLVISMDPTMIEAQPGTGFSWTGLTLQ
jgi:hypothetical protein